MSYIPNTDQDRREMLEKLGLESMADLFSPIPEDLKLKSALNLPTALSEMELMQEMEQVANRNKSSLSIFAGGGVYDHFIPSAVDSIISRPEFMTAYTPYQAEVSQGTLQAIYEYQTCICRLTGMDVANASMYDGASAAAEAIILSAASKRRSKVIISEAVNPLFRQVIDTYLTGRDIEAVIVPMKNGQTDFEKLESSIDDNTASVLLAQPNYFGLLEDIETAGEMIHEAGGFLIAAVDPISAMLLKTPADCGVDIVVGEGQPLGIPLNFGGPLLGFFAVREKLIRNIPGRLVARTVDTDGKPGFVLTLQTREQHIRRNKATSNICTNQALCATTALVYMSLMGHKGLSRVALLSLDKTHRMADKIFSIDGFEPYFEGDYIREVAIKTPLPAKELIEKLVDKNNILPGIDAGRFYKGMDDCLLLSVTEKRTETEIELLVKAIKEL